MHDGIYGKAKAITCAAAPAATGVLLTIYTGVIHIQSRITVKCSHTRHTVSTN